MLYRLGAAFARELIADEATARFAATYVDQNERDSETF
jgi:hypothetical protein